MTIQQQQWLSSKEARTKGNQTEARQAWINMQIHAEFLDLEKHVGWDSGHVIDQVVLRKQDEGWMGMIKAHRNGTAACAFVWAEDLPGLIALMGEFASRGVLTWQKDKYPSSRLKRLLGR